MLSFDAARATDLPVLNRLQVAAFGNEPLFIAAEPDAGLRPGFLTDVLSLEPGDLDCDDRVVLVARDHDTVVAVGELEQLPAGPLQPPTPQGWGALTAQQRWRTLVISSTAAVTALFPNCWYLSSLAVTPDRQGEGIGSRMLHDHVLAWVLRHSTRPLVLVTNTESNRRFYSARGFTVFDFRILDAGDHQVPNWSLVSDVHSPG